LGSILKQNINLLFLQAYKIGVHEDQRNRTDKTSMLVTKQSVQIDAIQDNGNKVFKHDSS
jgi:hypothetical protein